MLLVSSLKESNKNVVFAPPFESKDKRQDVILARKMKLPFKVAIITNSPMDSFN